MKLARCRALLNLLDLVRLSAVQAVRLGQQFREFNMAKSQLAAEPRLESNRPRTEQCFVLGAESDVEIAVYPNVASIASHDQCASRVVHSSRSIVESLAGNGATDSAEMRQFSTVGASVGVRITTVMGAGDAIGRAD